MSQDALAAGGFGWPILAGRDDQKLRIRTGEWWKACVLPNESAATLVIMAGLTLNSGVEVLDFGLAKMEELPSSGEEQARTARPPAEEGYHRRNYRRACRPSSRGKPVDAAQRFSRRSAPTAHKPKW